MTEETPKVAPPGGGFHVLPSEIVEPATQPEASLDNPAQAVDNEECEPCNRK